MALRSDIAFDMKIALIGYGKMGKVIEKVANSRGHEIVAALSRKHNLKLAKAADVAIEFTMPESAVENLLECLEMDLPVVCGTTGWDDQKSEVEEKFLAGNGSLIHATNFSLGVNLFFVLNEKLAEMMNGRDYNPSIVETHHIHKLDAPSGTAITLAEGILNQSTSLRDWKLVDHIQDAKSALPVKAIREDEVNGLHRIDYRSAEDRITLEHEAFSREGFALGAVIAAEWLKDKKGVYGMRDVLGL